MCDCIFKISFSMMVSSFDFDIFTLKNLYIEICDCIWVYVWMYYQFIIEWLMQVLD